MCKTRKANKNLRKPPLIVKQFSVNVFTVLVFMMKSFSQKWSLKIESACLMRLIVEIVSSSLLTARISSMIVKSSALAPMENWLPQEIKMATVSLSWSLLRTRKAHYTNWSWSAFAIVAFSHHTWKRWHSHQTITSYWWRQTQQRFTSLTLVHSTKPRITSELSGRMR